MQFARANDLLLCNKGGGHNIAGLATANGALMLDLSLMRGVWVDPQSKVAHAQGGCLLGEACRGHGEMGFAERVPNEPEHHTGLTAMFSL